MSSQREDFRKGFLDALMGNPQNHEKGRSPYSAGYNAGLAVRRIEERDDRYVTQEFGSCQDEDNS